MRIFNCKLVQNINNSVYLDQQIIKMKAQIATTIFFGLLVLLLQAQKPCSSTAQCTAVGSACLGGRCEKITLPTPTSCTVDTQCQIGFYCASGSCIPYPLTLCASNAECLAGFYCPSGQCIPSALPSPAACSSNAGCQTGFYCLGGVCTALPPITGCNAPQFYQASFACLKTCNHPDFVNCPSVPTPTVPTFRYCALLSSGGWVNFSLACEVCSSGTSVIAVDSQPCGCKHNGCPAGQQCTVNGCVNTSNSTCNNIQCPSNYYCQAGTCIRYNSPIVCGSILCGPGYQCLSNQCVLIGLPNPNACFNGQCPHGFYCSNGNCLPIINPPIELCSTVYCAPGSYCSNGMCKSFLPPSSCGAYSQFTPLGCLKSCSHPVFANCPNIFPLIYQPNFCAYTVDNAWIDFTFQCQACKSNSPRVIAVDDEPCSCKHYGCRPGQTCSNNVCVPQVPAIEISCATIRCSVGFYCFNRECLPIPPVVVCNSFSCSPGFACYQNKCYPEISSCSAITCPFGHYCVNNQCIQNTNNCNLMICPPGFVCQNNNCVQIINQPILSTCSNLICAYGYYCIANTCVQNPSIIQPTFVPSIVHPTFTPSIVQTASTSTIITCDRIICANGATCINNQCVFVKSSSSVVIISVDPCQNIVCFNESYCQAGKCIQRIPQLRTYLINPSINLPNQATAKPNERHSYVQIKDQFNPCYKKKCPEGYSCWEGICERMI